MAAYAALVSLLNNIHAITNHPTLSTSLHNKHIQSLLEKINFLLDFVEGNNYGAGSKEAAELERQIASAAHVAEHLIESHIVDQIHAGTSEAIPKPPYLLMRLLKGLGSHSFKKSLDLHHRIQDMDTLVRKVAAIKKKTRSKEEQQPAHLAGSVTNSGETAMVGLDTELNKLLDELTGNQSKRRIITIVGMGGSGFKLEWDDMAIIGSLPQLEVLKLRSIREYGSEHRWSPVEGQFHHLKALEIRGCDLEGWDAEESHFPVLKKLLLIQLLYLEEIPLCIGNIPTLELIRVEICSLSAAISAVRIKEDQLEYDNGQLQVRVAVWPHHMEGFNKMLETEELTADNIELKIKD